MVDTTDSTGSLNGLNTGQSLTSGITAPPTQAASSPPPTQSPQITDPGAPATPVATGGPITPAQNTQPGDRFYEGFAPSGGVKINLATGSSAVPAASSQSSVSQPQPVVSPPITMPSTLVDPLDSLDNAGIEQSISTDGPPSSGPGSPSPISSSTAPQPEMVVPQSVPSSRLPQTSGFNNMPTINNNIDSVAPQLPPTPYEKPMPAITSTVNVRGLLVIVAIGLGISIITSGTMYFAFSYFNGGNIKRLDGLIATERSKFNTLNAMPALLVDPNPTPTPTPEITPPPEVTPTPAPIPIPTETPAVIPVTTITPQGTG